MTRMGDIIQTLPLLKRLHEVHPGVQITFLCVSEFSEIARYTPFIHRYIKITASEAYSLKNTNDKKPIIEKILNHPFTKEKYNLVINLTHDSESGYISNHITSDTKSGLICEDEPIGYISDTWGRYLFSIVQNRLENSFNLVDIHMGMGKVSHKPIDNYLTVSERALQNVQSWLKKSSCFQKRSLVVFHLGASKSHRVWPVESFVRLGIMLVNETNSVIILTGRGNQEKLSVHKFLKLWHEAGQSTSFIINTVDQLDIHHLTALISKANLLISGDTGPIHIAAATGTKTIGIYLATAYPGETAPYGREHIVISPNINCYPCLRKPETGACNMECIDQIKPEYVFPIAKEVLEKDSSGVNKICKNIEQIRVRKSAFLSNNTLFYLPCHNNKDDKIFIQQIANRILWESILGIKSDHNLIDMVDLHSLQMLAQNILERLVDIKIDVLTIQKRLERLDTNNIRDAMVKYLYSKETLLKSKINGILGDYLFLIPPMALKSNEDLLKLWKLRLTTLDTALNAMKKLTL